MTPDGSGSTGPPDLAATLAWMRHGTEVMLAAVTELRPRDFDVQILLPEWDRCSLVAHLARNADALGRLLNWASTGVENPMYSSPRQRIDEIVASSRQSAPALLDDLRASTARLDEAVNQLPAHRWSSPVRSALGRSITAAEVPWLRAREVWLHAVDLNTTVKMADLPRDFLIALIDDVLATRRARGELTDVTLWAADELAWRAPDGQSREIVGDPSELGGWLTNRVSTDAPRFAALPALGRWI